MQQAEDGERGYLVTQDPAYLAALPGRRRRAARDEGRLAQLVADNPTEVAQVRDLTGAVERRRHLIDQVVATAQGGDFAGARGHHRRRPGPRRDGRHRARADKVNALENRLLIARTQPRATPRR